MAPRVMPRASECAPSPRNQTVLQSDLSKLSMKRCDDGPMGPPARLRPRRSSTSSRVEAERAKVDDDASQDHLLLPRLLNGSRRAVGLGANNWLYCASDDGAHRNSVLVSLLASCRLRSVAVDSCATPSPFTLSRAGR